MKKRIIFILMFLLVIYVTTAVEVYDSDFNKDYKVDSYDLTEFLEDFGKTDNYNYNYDLKENWEIDVYDLVVLAKNYGKTYSRQTKNYDIVVVGAGSGGVAAALQAARTEANVALLEETDYIGGQIIAVPNMDEGSHVTRDYGIYKEFIDKAKSKYGSKSLNTCYWSGNSMCMEPNIANQILVEMLNQENVDVFLNTKVYDVKMSGNTVIGVVTEDGKEFTSEVLIDATEYGDIIPLTGADYRISNREDSNIDMDSCIQDITYTAIIKKYSTIPLDLRMNNAPPGYNKNDFTNYLSPNGANWWQNSGSYPPDWTSYIAYRGIPDSTGNNYDSLNYNNAKQITKTGLNWGNDYPVDSRYLEDEAYRRKINCEAKLKTLQLLYYIQNELGKPWSISKDENFDTSYNIDNLCPNIPDEFKEIEKNMPPLPYVRESRRIIAEHTLTAGEIERTGDPPKADKSFQDSLAIGYYHNDLHGCKDKIETSFESLSDVPDEWTIGPFQVPFDSFIPENVDGFLAAEKNLGVTRLTNGATRLQPITMLTGQAAGAIAGLAVKNNEDVRKIKSIEVQRELVNEGSKISLTTFSDVPITHQYWKYIELINTRGLVSGYLDGSFGADDNLKRSQMAVVISRLAELSVSNPPETPTFIDVDKNEYYYKYIEAIYAEGITSGCNPDPLMYCPEDFVTRAEMAVFLVKALGETKYTGSHESFTDVPKSEWYHGWVEEVNELGIMGGYPDGTFKPNQEITRGEVSVVLSNSLMYKNNIN